MKLEYNLPDLVKHLQTIDADVGELIVAMAEYHQKKKFDKWLLEQPIVYINKIKVPRGFSQPGWSDIHQEADTHKARLVNVEIIE